VSNGFFKELEDALDNEWISMQDICAIFAGFCPIEPYQSNYGRADPNRRYKRISDGEVVKLSQSDVKEIDRYLDKWAKSDFTNPRTNPDAQVRDPRIIGGNDSEIRVRFAFKVGLGFRPMDERIYALYDAAIDAGLPPIEPSVPVDERIKQVAPPPKLSQSPMQDYLIQITKFEPDLTAGKLFARWEKEKPYCIDEIIPDKSEKKRISNLQSFTLYKYKYTTHSKDQREGDYNTLRLAIKNGVKYNENHLK
jgi:hypothetical protein